MLESLLKTIEKTCLIPTVDIGNVEQWADADGAAFIGFKVYGTPSAPIHRLKSFLSSKYGADNVLLTQYGFTQNVSGVTTVKIKQA